MCIKTIWHKNEWWIKAIVLVASLLGLIIKLVSVLFLKITFISTLTKILTYPIPLWIFIVISLIVYIIYRVSTRRSKSEMPEINVSQGTEMNPVAKSLNEDMANFICRCINASEKNLKMLLDMSSAQLVDEMNKQMLKKEIIEFMNPQIAAWMNSKTYFDENDKFRTASATFIRDNIKRLFKKRRGMF